MEGTSTCNNGHEDQVDGVLNGSDLDSGLLAKTPFKIVGQGQSTYNEITSQDLHDLRSHARPTLEEPL